MEAPEKTKGSRSIGRHLTFELGEKKYVLDVEKDTFEVKAKEVSYGFDIVSVVHRFVGQHCHCHIREL